MTPKRIVEVLGERLVQIGAMTPEAKRRRAVQFIALEAAIKLLTPEAEADRRLGAKVRAIGDSAEFDRLANRCRDRDDDDEGEEAFRAIATALREEGGR